MVRQWYGDGTALVRHGFLRMTLSGASRAGQYSGLVLCRTKMLNYERTSEKFLSHGRTATVAIYMPQWTADAGCGTWPQGCVDDVLCWTTIGDPQRPPTHDAGCGPRSAGMCPRVGAYGFTRSANVGHWGELRSAGYDRCSCGVVKRQRLWYSCRLPEKAATCSRHDVTYFMVHNKTAKLC